MACLVDSHVDQTKQGLPMEGKRGADRGKRESEKQRQTRIVVMMNDGSSI